MSVFYFKLRQQRQQHYLTGYAASVTAADSEIVLSDRRIPLVTFVDGKPVMLAHLLEDMTKPFEKKDGWAVWAYAVPTPEWWDRRALPEAEPAALPRATGS